MGQYNWKNHYAVCLEKAEELGDFRRYRVGEAGQGTVISCTVFPGIQAVYNDLDLFRCGRCVPKTEEVAEINYCLEGRYECEVNSQYCFFASPGDISVGSVGRREAAGSFPTGRFVGLTLFIELAPAGQLNERILREAKIDLDLIRRMAIQGPRRFYLRGRAEIDAVCRQMVSAMTGYRPAALKLKTLELLALISNPNLLQDNDAPAYLSQKNAQLAKDVRQRITSDLSRRLTLKQLSEELHTSPTAIKRAFKNVYGQSIREHVKSSRLQEAQRLLRESDGPIAEVAKMVGYGNPGHFAVAFREKFAMTPSDYRKLCARSREHRQA